MCGICGIVDYSGKGNIDEKTISSMAGTLSHRGPDDSGVKLFTDGGAVIAGLGHTRLSIIDLSARAHQPMENEDGSVWLVYNGEVFNFGELRAELEAKAHRFRSMTDSESVLHAYEEWGEECVKRLRGQFAFAIWDRKKKSLFMARDHVGIKPLYYMSYNGKFIFGSETKAILACPGVSTDVDLQGLNDFLNYEFIPAPKTLLSGILKLPPAHTLTLDKSGVRVSRFWDVVYKPEPLSEKEFAERLLTLLRDAVKSQLVSDVPLGAFLSGGLDSSTVVALMTQVAGGRVKTYSIGFEDKSYSELTYARRIAEAFGTAHEEFVISPKAVSLVEKLVRHLDDPIADFSVFPTYLVSKMARRYVTVSLTGDGGDEIFAGYDTYIAQKIARRLGPAASVLRIPAIAALISRLPPTAKKKGLINRLRRFVEGLGHPEDLRHFRWMVFMTEKDRNSLYSEEFLREVKREKLHAPILSHFSRAAGADELNKQLYVDLNTYLTDNCLLKVDRMSMACSLEVRVPLLDHRVIELMATLPPKVKLKGLTRKYILKKAMSGTLPQEILARGKQGFSIPMKNWLKFELKPMMLDLLSEESVRRRGYFRPEAVSMLIREHLEGRENHSHRLWALMLFECWAREFLR